MTIMTIMTKMSSFKIADGSSGSLFENILDLFGDEVSPARRRYRAFVEKGNAEGKNQSLPGED